MWCDNRKSSGGEGGGVTGKWGQGEEIDKKGGQQYKCFTEIQTDINMFKNLRVRKILFDQHSVSRLKRTGANQQIQI